MNNKERLERLINDIEEQSEIVSKEPHLMINIIVNAETFIPLLHNIKQDLEKIEALTVNVNVAQSLAKRYKQENDELKQALDKACLRLELYDTCPVYAELVEDLDCDECDNNCKECWKKYFMKEVLKNE